MIKKKLAVVFVVGFILVGLTASSKSDVFFEIKKNFTIFSDVFTEVSLRYVDEVEPGALIKTGIDAMLEMLDPYTVLIPENKNQEMDIITKGNYAGVGIEVAMQRGEIVVIAPIEGYSAHRKGIRTGDSIIEINGIPVNDLTESDIESQLYGEPGTEVELKIKRYGVDSPLSYVLQRERIDVKSVPYAGFIDEKNGVAYIQLLQFSQNCADEVRQSLQQLNAQTPIKSLVFDLRNNPGGLLDEAVSILNLFLPAGIEVVRIKGRLLDNNQVFLTKETPLFPNVKLILLQNAGSASASEIVAGVLQDLDRAVIIGERSYGKGLVQTIRPISYNNALKITSSRYFIPSGRSIQSLKYSHMERNEVSKVPDSLRQKYETQNGRIVFDGMGIEPDINLEEEEMDLFEIALQKDSHYFYFANEYVSRNDTITVDLLESKAFPEFKNYLKEHNFTYTSSSDRYLQGLYKSLSSSDSVAILPILDKVKAELEQRKLHQLSELSSFVKNQLFLELLSRYGQRKVIHPIVLKNDLLTQKAVQLFTQEKQYKQLLAIKN